MAGRFGASELSVTSPEPIDQALFGYADGHRQIASSFRLPPKDLYLLSSASDLASGTRLGENDSYLTGLPLPESRRFAFFRTWAAPEMPRPGCVWSHALLLESRTLASLPAFSDLLSLFRRPIERGTSQYGEPIDLMLSSFAESAAIELVSQVIEAYYVGRRATLSSIAGEAGEIERAVLAVWSQQWPRLRAGFSFCTAPLDERRRSESADYDVQVALFEELPSSDRQGWVSFAAADAAENRVTPLRRFLWRYGRDLTNSRRHYKMLIELFELSAGADEISADAASIVFDSLPEQSEGAVLKRDILGIGSTSPRMAAAISAVDLLELLTSKALPETPTPPQIRRRLEELTPAEIGKIARYYEDHTQDLMPWKEVITEAILALADRSTLLHPEFPPRLLAEVLHERADLIDAETVRVLSNDDLNRLLQQNASPAVVQYVISEMLQRDLGKSEDRIVANWPTAVLSCAIEALPSGQINQSWIRSIPRNEAFILNARWLDTLRSMSDLAVGLALLRFPRQLRKTANEISRCIVELKDDVGEADRTNVQAVLLRAAIDESSSDSWQLISLFLPELRVAVLQGSLPQIAHSVLMDDLPRFRSAAYWDLNKRILLSLSKLHRTFPNEDALRQLHLSESEARLVFFGEDENDVRNPLSRLWDWL
jgi:GTPase-associated protein 1, N-terminal domain type 1